MRGTEKLIPEAEDAARRFEQQCKYWGLNVLITDTLRSREEQEALYAKGRTAPGNIVTSCRYPHSLHNWGCAWDFCKNVKGHEYDDADFFAKCGQIAEDMGLCWGGSFKTPDRPHVQLQKYAPDKTAAYLCAHYASPEEFINEKKAGLKMDDKELTEALFRCITPELAREIVLAGINMLANEAADEGWQSDAVLWAAEKGIFRGDGRGRLMPQKPVTRAELAQALKNLCGE